LRFDVEFRVFVLCYFDMHLILQHAEPSIGADLYFLMVGLKQTKSRLLRCLGHKIRKFP